MKKIVLASFLLFTVAACSGSDADTTPSNTPDLEATVKVLSGTNVAKALTKIAEQAPPTVTSAIPRTTATVSTTLQISPAPTGFESEGICLSAELTSESPADNAVFLPGKTFEKTWWLRNTGDCAWTDEYSFVFQRGNVMGALARHPFPGYVAPGQAIPFILNLTAPGDPGTHRGFWELENPAGVRFGVGSGGSAPFYVQIVVPGPTPTPKSSTRGPQTWGNIRSDGNFGDKIEIGDTGSNLSFEGYMTFEFGNIPNTASVVYLVLDIDQGRQISGDPFTDLGCLNVYADNYPGVPLWRFCSAADLGAGIIRIGGPDAIAAFNSGIAAGFIRLTLAFDLDTNNDGSKDTLEIKVVVLQIDFIP